MPRICEGSNGAARAEARALLTLARRTNANVSEILESISPTKQDLAALRKGKRTVQHNRMAAASILFRREVAKEFSRLVDAK
jgi:hypothetical protein